MGRTARVIRVFVSSPDDVAAERAVLEEIVSSVNRTEGDAHGLRLELFRWEKDVVPQIGPSPSSVIDDQTPPFDIYLGIMSARFGTPTEKYGSGTEKEFRDALTSWKSTGAPWIMFYFNDDPRPSRDPKKAMEWVKVCEFRQGLESQGIVSGYTGTRGTKDGFYERASDHLRMVIHRLGPSVSADPPGSAVHASPPADPTVYLRDLLEKTAYIDIRGLQVGTGRANRFPIEELFISLTTSQGPDRATDDPKRSHPALAESRTVPLHDALRHDRLVIVGDPGAGKTTFLRRLAYALCQAQLGDVPEAALDRLGITDRTFPIFLRINELAQHIARNGQQSTAPAGDAAAWLPHFLGAAGTANGCGLDAEFFRRHLESGVCTVLLDGLDEAPDRLVRERMSRLIENLRGAYGRCRFVVTSRPTAYTGEVVLPDFALARIDPLSEEAVKTFLSRWSDAIHAENPGKAQDHSRELLDAVRARPDIRRMARNPVMLTALAVVHWNERRLPEQRADLYNSILIWLSRSREQRPGRASAEETIVLLQELALAMQDDPEGRKTQVPKRWAAEKIAGVAGGSAVTAEAVRRAERFLDEEEVDSGILVGRGNEVSFWHLTFQEFLAAKAIAGRLEAGQTQILFGTSDKLYLPDWREVVLLLAGALHQQGRAKVDGFIGGFLGGLGAAPRLADQARCAGLVGAVLRDLEPLRYQVSDARYGRLLDAVMAIFDPKRFRAVPIEERIAAADALGQAGDPRIDLRIDPRRDDGWVTIPAGSFWMGAQKTDPKKRNYDSEARPNEEPVHEVRLDSYRIARYLVTVGQYQRFVEDEGYEDQRWWQAGGFGMFSGPEEWEGQQAYPSRPVVGVSWFEAKAFCAWAAVRLPTEAEWERAARGTEGRTYPWGNEAPDVSRVNFAPEGKSAVGHPTPVGAFPLDATPDGIYDMGGNVLEWCDDGYGDYPAEALVNPRGSESAAGRVIRGGSWWGIARFCRAASRGRNEPVYRFVHLGFRVAAVPSSQSGSVSSSGGAGVDGGA